MPRGAVLFAAFSESWSEKVLPLWKPSSSVSSKSIISRYLIPEFGNLKLHQVTTEMVQGLVSKMSSKGLSRHTITNVLAVLASILRSAVKWGHKVATVDFRGLSLPCEQELQKGKTFSPEQVRLILENSEEPARTLWATAAMTGLRSGELAGLQWDDIDMEARALTVRRSCFRGKMQSVKSKAGNRTVPLPDQLVEMLEQHMARTGTEGLVFKSTRGTPINPQDWATRRLAPVLKKLGIPRAGLHAFRHAQASALVATGANPKVAQAQLGHSDIRVTLNLYSHVIGDDHRKAVSQAASMFAPLHQHEVVKAG